MSETAVSAAKRACGSCGAFEISLTSSITAATGVLKTKRRSMSSLTLWIVSCALRARGVGDDRAGDLRVDDTPQTREEAPHPLDAGVLPLLVLICRPHEQDVEAQRIGSEPFDEFVGRD